MSLDLDKRQRAMLAEMGVQVWLPETPVAQALAAVQAAVVDAENLAESKALPALTPVVPAVPVAPVAAMRPTVPVPQAPLPIAPARSHGSAEAGRSKHSSNASASRSAAAESARMPVSSAEGSQLIAFEFMAVTASCCCLSDGAVRFKLGACWFQEA